MNLDLILNIIQNCAFKETGLFFGKSCAIIGNSGSILSAENGNIIDRHDFVIRMNQARVRGYEKYVGSKTNLRILNLHSFLALNGVDEQELKATFSSFSSDIFKELREKNYLTKYHSDLSIAITKYPDIKFDKITLQSDLILRRIAGQEPTTGLIALILALKYFNKISCYGFDFYDGSVDHYFEQIKKYDRTNAHNLEIEKDIFQCLDKINRISLN